jgi:hypothetical protein
VTFFDGTVIVVVVVGMVVVVVDVDVLVVVGVVVEVLDEVVVDVVDEVLCRIDAGLLPATTAAAKPPSASVRHAASAVPNLRMGKTPFLVCVSSRIWRGSPFCRRPTRFQTPFRSGNVKEHFESPLRKGA